MTKPNRAPSRAPKRLPHKLNPTPVRYAIGNGVDARRLVTEVFVEVTDFLRATRLTVDAQAMVIGMLQQDIEDRRADDSCSWSDEQPPIFPNMSGRAE